MSAPLTPEESELAQRVSADANVDLKRLWRYEALWNADAGRASA